MNHPPIIDEGILKAPTGLRFRYRCFINQPLGIGILYSVDKTPEVVEQEIQIEHEGLETVLWQNTGQVLAVFKHEDGSVEVPRVLLNVYANIIKGEFELIYVEEQYEKDHDNLMSIFQKYYVDTQ